jgi:membrane protein implicated in regulation of membrane protease activity
MLASIFSSDLLLFTVPALFGTVVFLLRLGLMLLGGGHGDVHAAGADLDLDTAAPEPGHGAESTSAFQFLSFQSIAAFLMGFGWGGLVGMETFGWGVARSVIAGLVFGGLLMWLLGILLRAVYELQASGHVRIDDAVGSDGTVYADIPAREEGRGQVRVVIGDRARFYQAVSDDDALPTGTRVRVQCVNSDNTLTVTRA